MLIAGKSRPPVSYQLVGRLCVLSGTMKG